MKFDDKVTEEEKKIFKEVDSLSSMVLEDYIEGWGQVRHLGNVLLKTVSKIENELDETIIAWNEKIKHPYSLTTRLELLSKYTSLLSKMYFLGKIDALKEYGLINKKDSFYKNLRWLNDERNKFAHYGVYQHMLVNEYGLSKNRIEVLKKLRMILKSSIQFKAAVQNSIDNPRA